jgi:hypothetical protein
VQRQYSIVLNLNCFKEERMRHPKNTELAQNTAAAQRFPKCIGVRMNTGMNCKARSLALIALGLHPKDSAKRKSKTVLIANCNQHRCLAGAAERPHRNLRP